MRTLGERTSAACSENKYQAFHIVSINASSFAPTLMDQQEPITL